MTPFSQEEKEMFDQVFERKLTYRQFFRAQHRDFIILAKALEKEMGKDKAIAFIKDITTQRMSGYGKAQAGRSSDNSLNAYVEQFRSEKAYKNLLRKEIVEDTEKAFELKVTKCIWADSFRGSDAADIGYAWVCWGDYAWAEGFNPKIKMVRDKTLMQGDDLCNHRYVWTD
jgi:hypothetical protein